MATAPTSLNLTMPSQFPTAQMTMSKAITTTDQIGECGSHRNIVTIDRQADDDRPHSRPRRTPEQPESHRRDQHFDRDGRVIVTIAARHLRFGDTLSRVLRA